MSFKKRYLQNESGQWVRLNTNQTTRSQQITHRDHDPKVDFRIMSTQPDVQHHLKTNKYENANN